MYVQQLWCI